MGVLDRDSSLTPRYAGCATVFVVSPHPAVRDSLVELLAPEGLHAETFESLDAWWRSVEPARRGCLVLDAPAGAWAPAGALQAVPLAAICGGRPVLLLIDRGDVPFAVSAIKSGATDVLEKPCRDERLLDCIRRLAAMTGESGRAGGDLRR